MRHARRQSTSWVCKVEASSKRSKGVLAGGFCSMRKRAPCKRRVFEQRKLAQTCSDCHAAATCQPACPPCITLKLRIPCLSVWRNSGGCCTRGRNCLCVHTMACCGAPRGPLRKSMARICARSSPGQRPVAECRQRGAELDLVARSGNAYRQSAGEAART